MDKPRSLKPKFDEFLATPARSLSNPEHLREGVRGVVKRKNIIPHGQLLEQLKQELEPMDFLRAAFPELENLEQSLAEAQPGSSEAKQLQKKISRLKLTLKHYLILSIEHILSQAEQRQWGLCLSNGFVHLYNGAYWAQLDDEVLQKFLGESAERIGVPKFDAKHYKFREQLLKQFMALAYMEAPSVSGDLVLINLQNGTFEIDGDRTQLRPFRSEDFLTYQLPFAFDPSVRAPMFQTYLDQVLPEKEKQMVLAEYVGSLFIRHGCQNIKIEKALVLYGSGANGKSVFFEILNALLGPENISNFSLQNLTNESGYFRAKIGSKLVNYASEINGRLECSLFKQLVSGEPVDARLPYRDPFIMTNYAKLIFNANVLPREVENNNAYFRRFLIIPFEVTIPEEQQDRHLHTKIITNELSGVFNWALQGLRRLLQQGAFTECAAIDKALQEYKEQTDSVRQFLLDHDYEGSAETYQLIKDLYSEYRYYCQLSGFMPVNKTSFKSRLEAAQITTGRKSKGNVAYVVKSTSQEKRF